MSGDFAGGTAPGWYPDPSGAPGLRWWNGELWTDQRQATPESAAPPPAGRMPAGMAPATGAGVDARSGLPYADYGKRVLAYLIDAAVVWAGFIALFVMSFIVGAVIDVLGSLLFIGGWLLLIAGSVAIFVVGEGGPLGQTPGKHLMGIRVIGPAPGPLGYGRAAGRWLGRILDTLVCGLPLGLLWPLWDAQRRTWHDMVVDTRVVVAQPGPRSIGYWLRNVRG